MSKALPLLLLELARVYKRRYTCAPVLLEHAPACSIVNGGYWLGTGVLGCGCCCTVRTGLYLLVGIRMGARPSHRRLWSFLVHTHR
jgi:hypothetical protein